MRDLSYKQITRKFTTGHRDVDIYGIAKLKSAMKESSHQMVDVKKLTDLIDLLPSETADKWLNKTTKQKHKGTFNEYLKEITDTFILLVNICQNPENYQNAEMWLSIQQTLNQSIARYDNIFKTLENGIVQAPVGSLNKQYEEEATQFFSDTRALFREVNSQIPKHFTEIEAMASYISHRVKNSLRTTSIADNKVTSKQHRINSGARAAFYQLGQLTQAVARDADRLKERIPIKTELSLEGAKASKPNDEQLQELNRHIEGTLNERKFLSHSISIDGSARKIGEECPNEVTTWTHRISDDIEVNDDVSTVLEDVTKAMQDKRLFKAMSQIEGEREAPSRIRRSLPSSRREPDRVSFLENYISYLRQFAEKNLNRRLEQLGVSREQVKFVNLFFNKDGTGKLRNAIEVHNLGTYAVIHDEGAITFFSTMDEEIFTLNSWGEATHQINDRDSQLALWMRKHTSEPQQGQYNHDFNINDYWDDSHLEVDFLVVNEERIDRQSKTWLQHFSPKKAEDYIYASSVAWGDKKKQFSYLLNKYTKPAIPVDAQVMWDGKSYSLLRLLSTEFDRSNINRNLYWMNENGEHTLLDLDTLLSLYTSISRADENENTPKFLSNKNKFDREMQRLPESQRKSVHDLVKVDGKFMSIYDFISGPKKNFNESIWPKDIEVENNKSIDSLRYENVDMLPDAIGVIERIRLQNWQESFEAQFRAYSEAALPLHGLSIIDMHFREILRNKGISNTEDYHLTDRVTRVFQPSRPITVQRLGVGPLKPLPEPIYNEFSISDLFRNLNEPRSLGESTAHYSMQGETWDGGEKYGTAILKAILKADSEEWWKNKTTIKEDTWRHIKSELISHGAKSVDDVEFLKIIPHTKNPVFNIPYKAVGVYKVTRDDGTIAVFSVGNSNVDWIFENEKGFKNALSPKKNGWYRAGKGQHAMYKNDNVEALFSHSRTIPAYKWGYSVKSTPIDNGNRDYKHWEAEDALLGGVYNLDKLVKSDGEITLELINRAISAALVVGSILAAPFSGGVSLLSGMTASVPHFVNAANADTEEEAISYASEGLWTLSGELAGQALSQALKPLISKIVSTIKLGGRSAAKALSTVDDFNSPAASKVAQSLKIKGNWERFVDAIDDFSDNTMQFFRAKKSDLGELAARYASDQSLAVTDITRNGVCWDAVYRLEFNAGKISKRELEALSSSTRSFSWHKSFLGESPVKIKSMEELSNLPTGSRIAFEEQGQLKHAMVAADGGRTAYGANNGYIGKGPGWEKVSLEDVLKQNGNGGFNLASTNRPINIWSSKTPSSPVEDVVIIHRM